MTSEQINAEGCDQAPIHSLPDEILEVIFLINTSKLVEQGDENHPYDPHSTTLATAQVCQRWRAVALNYPFIWSRIINYEQHSPLWIETLLARSGSTLIDVGGDSASEPVRLQHPRGKPVLQSIFQRIANLKTIGLRIRRDPCESICRSFLGRPAPNLEFLNFATSCSFPHCFYPNPLFADEAPCLRRLYLERCLIDFTSRVLSNLTELSVRNITTVMSASAHSHRVKLVPSVARWLRVLMNIPTLRILTLSNAISDFTAEHEPLPVVDLPHLTLLTINTGFNSGIPLIDHLNIPPSCGIRLKLNHGRSPTDGLYGPKLLSFLSKQLTHWPQDCFNRYLQARILSGHTIHFRNSKYIHQALYMTESDEVEAHSRNSRDPVLSFILTFDHLEGSFALFNQLLELYSSTFSTTTTLDLGVDQEFEGMAMAGGSFPALPTFHSFTNVKTLNLLEQSPLYLLPLFHSLSDHPLFPALQSLHLTDTNMDDRQGAMYSVFVAFLLKRAEAGIPLREIKMLGGYISSQTAEDLSRVGNLQISLDSMSLHYLNTTMEPNTDDEI